MIIIINVTDNVNRDGDYDDDDDNFLHKKNVWCLNSKIHVVVYSLCIFYMISMNSESELYISDIMFIKNF